MQNDGVFSYLLIIFLRSFKGSSLVYLFVPLNKVLPLDYYVTLTSSKVLPLDK